MLILLIKIWIKVGVEKLLCGIKIKKQIVNYQQKEEEICTEKCFSFITFYICWKRHSFFEQLISVTCNKQFIHDLMGERMVS